MSLHQFCGCLCNTGCAKRIDHIHTASILLWCHAQGSKFWDNATLLFFFSHVASCVNVGNLINWYHVTASRFRLISKCTDWAIFQLTLAFNYFWANITVYSIVRLSMCLTLATWNTVIQHWTLSLGVWCWRETAAVWLWSIVESDLRIVMTLQSILSASWKAQRLEISHSTIWDLQKKKQKKKNASILPQLDALTPKM